MGPGAHSLAALVLCAQTVAAQQAGAPPWDESLGFAGPTGQVQQHPLRQALVDVPARGQVSHPWVRVERSEANVWNSWLPLRLSRHAYALHLTDVQLESLVVDVGAPVLPWLAVGARLGAQRLWGGGPVDGLIEDFHHQFVFYNFDRENAPTGRTQMFIQGGARGSPSIQWQGERALTPSPLLSVFVTLLRNRTTVLTLRGDLQLPLGDVATTLNLRAAESALGIFLWRRLLNVAAFHVSAHWLMHSNGRLGGLTVLQQGLVSASAELRVLPQATLLFEDRLQSPLLERANVLDDMSPPLRSTAYNGYFTPVNLITVGVRWYLSHTTAMTVYAGEDFMLCTACVEERYSRENNSPDITLSLTLEQLAPGVWP